MVPDDLDPLDQRDRYWHGRQLLSETIAAAREALERRSTAELRQLLLRVGELEIELRALAEALELRAPPSQIRTLLAAYTQAQRDRLLDDGGDPVRLIDSFAQLIELERQLVPPDEQARGEARAAALAVLGARAERELAQAHYAEAALLAEAMLRADGEHAPAQLLLLRALLGQIRKARAAGDLERLERELLPQAEGVRGRLGADPETITRRGALDEELRRERAALALALGAQAEQQGQRRQAEELYRRALGDARYGGEAEARLARLRARPPLWRPLGAALLALGALLALAAVLSPALRGQLCAAVGVPCPAQTALLTATPVALSSMVVRATSTATPAPPQPTVLAAPTSLAVPMILATSPMAVVPSPGSAGLPSPTATPVPLLGRLINDRVAVYADPVDSSQEIALLPVGSLWHLCARAANRYLIATTNCHLTQPLGWVTLRNFEPQFEGQFPRALVTPLPTPSP